MNEQERNKKKKKKMKTILQIKYSEWDYIFDK